MGSWGAGGSESHTTLKFTSSLLPRALSKQGGKGAALRPGCTMVIVFGWWHLPMASRRRRLGGCVRGVGEMSLETPSPPASHGLGPQGVMVRLESLLVSRFCLKGGPKPTLPTRVECCNPPTSQTGSPKHSHPSRSRSLLRLGWLAASLSCWARHSHPTSSSLLPAPGVAGLAMCCAPGTCTATSTLPGGGRDALHRAEGAQAPVGG